MVSTMTARFWKKKSRPRAARYVLLRFGLAGARQRTMMKCEASPATAVTS